MKIKSPLCLAVFFLCLGPVLANAQTYPTKPVRIVVGFPPGGTTDPAARLLAAQLEKRIGQPFIVDNKPGAAGAIGANYVIKADPDGYTLLFASAAGIHPIFVKTSAIDAGKELLPISNVAAGALVFSVRPDLPVRSLQDLVGYAKSNPGKLNFGSAAAVGSMLMRVLSQRTGITYMEIPYKGDTPATTALLAGEIDVSANGAGGVKSFIDAGRLRPIFTPAPRRSSLLPDVPTATELGIKDFAIQFNLVLWAPLKTQRAIIDRLQSQTAAALATSEVAEQFRRLGLDAASSTPEEALRGFESEIHFWSEAARLANYQPQ